MLLLSVLLRDCRTLLRGLNLVAIASYSQTVIAHASFWRVHLVSKEQVVDHNDIHIVVVSKKYRL